MMFVVGARGLTGSAIVRYAKKNQIEYMEIQRENKEDFFGKSCDTLVFANGNAEKFKANQDSFFDFHASVSSAVEYIHKIKYKNFVLLSTVDVYNEKSDEKTSENTKIDESKLETYGYHKYLVENYVRHYCHNHMIFRLGGLVGEGLKKNPAYYFIKKDSKVTVSPESIMNFIHTRNVAEIIFEILGHGFINETFNLASKDSIKIKDLKNIIGYDSEYSDESGSNIQKYIINTKKIQKYVELPTSNQSITEYFTGLKNRT